MPAAEVHVDAAVVRTLLAEQFPDLAGLPVRLLANGWDNVLYRIGEELVARLPRRRVAVPLIESEQRWLPELARDLPLPVPEPVGIGVPGAGYPWPWTVCRHLPGDSLLALVDAGGRLADPVEEARRLGAFHRALHRPAAPDAPANPYRGVPLVERHDRLLGQLDDLGDAIDQAAAEAVWGDALTADTYDGAPLWLHGDPHPGNLLTDGATICGVIDFGDLTGGDPATDLAAGWLVFGPEARAAYREAAGVDDDAWRRARGWALCMGVAMLTTSQDNPPYLRLGQRTVAAVLADVSR